MFSFLFVYCVLGYSLGLKCSGATVVMYLLFQRSHGRAGWSGIGILRYGQTSILLQSVLVSEPRLFRQFGHVGKHKTRYKPWCYLRDAREDALVEQVIFRGRAMQGVTQYGKMCADTPVEKIRRGALLMAIAEYCFSATTCLSLMNWMFVYVQEREWCKSA